MPRAFVTGSASLWGYWQLARPPDTALALIGTFLGAGLAGIGGSELSTVVALACSNALLSAASMTFNDWHDVDEDRINAPARPIPSGIVTRECALGAAVGLFALGFLAAWSAAPVFGIASLGITTVSVAYTSRLKAIPLVGHASTALLSAYPLWCWMFATGVTSVEYAGASAGFTIAGIGREVTRTVADAAGDRGAGIRTVATLYGGAVGNRLGCGLVALGLLVAGAPTGIDPLCAYPIVLAMGMLAVVHHVLFPLRRLPDPTASLRFTRLTRALTGLLAAAVAWDLLGVGWPVSQGFE